MNVISAASFAGVAQLTMLHVEIHGGNICSYIIGACHSHWHTSGQTTASEMHHHIEHVATVDREEAEPPLFVMT
jgi:hypothetical protein